MDIDGIGMFRKYRLMNEIPKYGLQNGRKKGSAYGIRFFLPLFIIPFMRPHAKVPLRSF